MNIKKRNGATTIEEAINLLSGEKTADLIISKTADETHIENLIKGAKMCVRAIDKKMNIVIVGDYDADGVCSSAILTILFKEAGITPTVIIPKRMSEGYGFSPSSVEEIPSGSFVITVDNGIAAHEAIKAAVEKGIFVMVLDHHLPSEVLPEAHLIIDPHINPQNNTFCDVCGGGLSYLLSLEILKMLNHLSTNKLKGILCSLAAIATIADVMPLKNINRTIVKQGLVNLNERITTKGLISLIEELEMTVISEKDLGFKIAPIINAAGRLYDDGAKMSFDCISENEKTDSSLAKKLIEANENRKALVDEQYKKAVSLIEDPEEVPIIIKGDFYEGIVGIIAGKLCEEYKCPAFVFSELEDGTCKGSARSCEGVDIKRVLDVISEHIVQFGGHAGAAGVTVLSNSFNLFKDALIEELVGFELAAKDEILYDLEIQPNEVGECIQKLNQYAPFGMGCPAPIFLVKNIKLEEGKKKYLFMGKDKVHLKLGANGFSLIAFGMANKYQKLNLPSEVNAVGSLAMNESKYGSVIQIEVIDFE